MCNIKKNVTFHVTSGYPPDVLHDLLEGIVPFELAFSFDVLIKKYFLTNSMIPFVTSHISGVIKRIVISLCLVTLPHEDQWEAMPMKISVYCVYCL